jgi:hypothetical protein
LPTLVTKNVIAPAEPTAPAAPAVVADAAVLEAGIVDDPYPDEDDARPPPPSPDGADEHAAKVTMPHAMQQNDSPVFVRMKESSRCARSGRCMVGSRSTQRQCVTRRASG